MQLNQVLSISQPLQGQKPADTYGDFGSITNFNSSLSSGSSASGTIEVTLNKNLDLNGINLTEIAADMNVMSYRVGLRY